MWAVCITVSLMVLGCQVDAGAGLNKFDHDIEFEAWNVDGDMGGAEVFMIHGSDDVVTEELRNKRSASATDIKMELPAKKEERLTDEEIPDLTFSQIVGYFNCTDLIHICDDYADVAYQYCNLPAYKEACAHTCDIDYNCDIGEIESCGNTEGITQDQRLQLAELFGEKLEEELEYETPDINPQSNCPNGYYKCEGLSQCIALHHLCDGIDDCSPNNDDESPEICHEYSKCDPYHQFQCNNKQCISYSKKCDEEIDCEDGSDEEEGNCQTCNSNQFECHHKHESHGQCINSENVCNGVNDCGDGSDEEHCLLYSTTSSSTTTSESTTSSPTTTSTSTSNSSFSSTSTTSDSTTSPPTTTSTSTSNSSFSSTSTTSSLSTTASTTTTTEPSTT